MNHKAHFLGGDSQGGTYVLRIYVPKQITMAFGRFKGGKKIHVPAGDYIYTGSALAETGSMCLARRLVRHASRTGSKPAHPIRKTLLRQFASVGLGPENQRPTKKRCRWNVDYLADHLPVDLTAMYAIRSPERIEFDIADMLEDDADTVVIEKGLGANDHPGHTHLLLVDAGENWWRDLPARLQSLVLGEHH